MCHGFLSTEVAEKRTNPTAFVSAQINMGVRMIMSVLLVTLGYLLYLKPTVDHTKTADYNICGEDLDFAFADHPSGLPMFTLIDDSDKSTEGLQCYFDAYEDMVRMRAGFNPLVSEKNDTLISLVRGTNERCKDVGPGSTGSLDCPSAKYAIVADEMAEAEILESVFCRDRDVSFFGLTDYMLSQIKLCRYHSDGVVASKQRFLQLHQTHMYLSGWTVLSFQFALSGWYSLGLRPHQKTTESLSAVLWPVCVSSASSTSGVKSSTIATDIW